MNRAGFRVTHLGGALLVSEELREPAALAARIITLYHSLVKSKVWAQPLEDDLCLGPSGLIPRELDESLARARGDIIPSHVEKAQKRPK